MKKNVGKIDRIVRVIVGLGLLSLGLLLDGNIRWVALLGVPLIASALTGVCFLYCPLKISTCCSKNEDQTCEQKSCCGNRNKESSV